LVVDVITVRALAVLGAIVWTTATASAATITGTVIGEGARPIAGATVFVVGALPPCTTTSGPDGIFSFSCAATGMHAVRATFGDLRPWQVDDIALAPDADVHLNFMLLPVTAPTLPSSMEPVGTAEPGFWSRPVPNPVVATWGERPITLRMLAIVVAALCFPLGALTMFALGRRFGVQTRRLSPDEVGDMVLNPNRPTVGERTTPIATVGARGAEATVSYGADEIAAALAEKRWGLVLAALVVAPGLFAASTFGFGVAVLVGQETWLLAAMLLVPAGFLLTPIMIGVQALGRR
jgi:hypothetical protein